MDIGTPGSISPSTSSHVTPSASHSAQRLAAGHEQCAGTLTALKPTDERRCHQSARGIARRARWHGHSHHRIALRRGDLRSGHGMVTADQRQDRPRQIGPRHRRPTGQSTGKATRAAPQHAARQCAALRHDRVQIGIALGIAQAHPVRQVDAGVAPAIAVAHQLPATAGDAPLERKCRRHDAVIEARHARRKFQCDMATQQAVDLLERRRAAVEQRSEPRDRGVAPASSAGSSRVPLSIATAPIGSASLRQVVATGPVSDTKRDALSSAPVRSSASRRKAVIAFSAFRTRHCARRSGRSR